MKSVLAAVFAVSAAAVPALPRAWVTDPRTEARLAPLAVQSATNTPEPPRRVVVDPNRLEQTVAGFGASLTESAATVLMTLSQADRTALLRDLFSNQGLGLSVLRQPIGAPDFARSVFSLDDVAPGETDFALNHFSIARDREAVLPLLRQAAAIQPKLLVIASPWSPPAWMKTGGSMLGASGGVLRSDCYEVYARYFARFVSEYEKEGVTVFAVTPQNEPAYGPPQYPGMVWPVADYAKFVREFLGPTLARDAPGTAILGWDHNYDGEAYARSLLADRATAKWLRGTAWHDYGGDPSSMGEVARAYPDKEVWMTEGGLGSWQGAFPARFQAGLMQGIAALENGARSYVLWNAALDARGGPIVFPNTANEGLVTVDGGTVTRNAGYYALAHFSRFVAPGDRRVHADSDGQAVAFAVRSGIVVVLGNPFLSSHTVRVVVDTRAVDVEVPAQGAVTLMFNKE